MRKRPGLALIAAVLLLQGPMGRASLPQRATWLGTYVWHGAGRWFGGFSGLEFSADGRHFVALSDRGHYLQGAVTRGPSGAVTGVTPGPVLPLPGPGGRRLHSWQSDSEGLAIAPDGRMFVSFEGVQRVLEYDRIGGPGRVLPRDPDFLKMQKNGSLEPLAVAPDGDLYTLPERGPAGEPNQVYRYHGGRWTVPFTIPRIGDFKPVGADFGPEGKFYLLERRFAGLFGFATRVRRFDFGPGGPGRGEVLLQTRPGRFDNLEGIALWRDGRVRIRMTMVSDDNFSIFQRTELVDYAVTE